MGELRELYVQHTRVLLVSSACVSNGVRHASLNGKQRERARERESARARERERERRVVGRMDTDWRVSRQRAR
jgi:hypothetical protein